MDDVTINYTSSDDNAIRRKMENVLSGSFGTLAITEHALLSETDIKFIFTTASRNPKLVRIFITRHENPRLVDLNLNYDYYITNIKRCILSNERLTCLDLLFCRFSEAAIFTLMEWITKWSRLVVLTLKDPYHTTATLVKVTELLADNNTLENVFIDVVRIKDMGSYDVADIKQINANVKRNKRMQFCSFALDTDYTRHIIESARIHEASMEIHNEMAELIGDDEHSLSGRVTANFLTGRCVNHAFQNEDIITDWTIGRHGTHGNAYTSELAEANFMREVLLKRNEPVVDQCKLIQRVDFAGINMEAGLPQFLVNMCCNVRQLSFVDCSIFNENTILATRADEPPAGGIQGSVGKRAKCGDSRGGHAEAQ